MQFLSQESPNRIALSFEDQKFSFAELETAIQKMSPQLKKLPPGILVLHAIPQSSFVIQLLAALNIGKPVALFAPQELGQEKRHLLGTNMTVCEQGKLIDIQENNHIKHHPELALVLFTSGSTGQMKAVQLSLKNITANCKAVINALEFSRIDDQLLFLPLSYSFGLLGQLLPGLIAGIKTQLITQFTDIKTLLETHAVPQMWSGVPSHWVAIHKMASLFPESAAKIKAIVSAGAPLSITLRHRLIQTFPNAIIYNNYGLTEAAPRVLTYSNKDPLFLEDFAGYPVGDWQIRLSEENELLIKGSQLMLGYLGEEKQTRMHNGWFFTGDLAEKLPSGLVAIKGRLDHIVNIGGEKVNLIDIEHKICQIEGIKEVIVIPLDDELYGVRLLACLEQDNFSATTTEHMLSEQLKQHFLPKKLPITVHLLKKLPRNQHGKLDRKALLLSQKEKIHAH
ncbi:long-chain fatty acid--CoA ligase [Legionella qingyii]|uniref:Long-chain fatty acid--CoA ligase n=1 Tax=Legionella qingyii TaxID=2184757 RepID=A0A317U1W6_9GAMM|nr:class I adenylate-forming enzyme family protein [Legionella qingyii]PWY55228.1 long-chain fatty acid--CoA ligase [Legionella qingyii]RUR25347.1 long-chain fatty acid--CoA ligase [Legionella qingyii]RUR28542.1 long-chain fatty acid--CoA ligase [Legionella qingyii]